MKRLVGTAVIVGIPISNISISMLSRTPWNGIEIYLRAIGRIL